MHKDHKTRLDEQANKKPEYAVFNIVTMTSLPVAMNRALPSRWASASGVKMNAFAQMQSSCDSLDDLSLGDNGDDNTSLAESTVTLPNKLSNWLGKKLTPNTNNGVDSTADRAQTTNTTKKTKKKKKRSPPRQHSMMNPVESTTTKAKIPRRRHSMFGMMGLAATAMQDSVCSTTCTSDLSESTMEESMTHLVTANNHNDCLDIGNGAILTMNQEAYEEQETTSKSCSKKKKKSKSKSKKSDDEDDAVDTSSDKKKKKKDKKKKPKKNKSTSSSEERTVLTPQSSSSSADNGADDDDTVITASSRKRLINRRASTGMFNIAQSSSLLITATRGGGASSKISSETVVTVNKDYVVKSSMEDAIGQDDDDERSITIEQAIEDTETSRTMRQVTHDNKTSKTAKESLLDVMANLQGIHTNLATVSANGNDTEKIDACLTALQSMVAAVNDLTSVLVADAHHKTINNDATTSYIPEETANPRLSWVRSPSGLSKHLEMQF